MLRLMVGEIGSGRTARIHQEWNQRIRAERNVKAAAGRMILIVPEQISFQEQKALIGETPARGMIGAEVLSFHRLAHRVLSEQGDSDLEILDEVGKNMLLYRVAQELAPQMVYFGQSVHSQGFLQRLGSIFAEFSQYEVTQEQLDAALAAAPPESTLHAKLQDLAAMHARYTEALKQYGEVSEKLLDRLAEAVPQSDFLAGARVYVDDFYGFTPQQMRVLGALLHRTEELVVTLTMPPAEARRMEADPARMREDLFATPCRTFRMLLNLVHEQRLPYRIDYLDAEPANCQQWTARAFFAPAAGFWHGSGLPIRLVEAVDKQEEIRSVMETILALVRERDYRYREIGIVLCDPEGYERPFRKIAQEYGMPLFMDDTSGIMAHPFVRMLLSLFQMIRTHCSYDTLFAFLKTGFTPFTRDQLDRLDNLVLKRGWRGYSKMRAAMLAAASGDPNQEIVELYVERLSGFLEKASGQNEAEALWWCDQLQQFMEAAGAELILNRQADRLRREGLYLREAQCRQIYDKVCRTLDRIRQILPQTTLDAEAFRGILAAGLSQIKVGMLPPELDQIVVGDMNRSRFHRIRALFILGFGEAGFPRVTQDAGILLERERAQLGDCMQLAPGSTGQLCDQQLRLYSLLAAPSDYVEVSYEKNIQQGEASQPSLYWRRFAELLGPGVYKEPVTEANLAEPAFLNYGRNRGSDPRLEEWFRKHPPYAARLSRLDEASRIRPEELSPETAASLWNPETWEVSITRMEQFGRCPYAHFLKYGLGLKERERLQTTFADDGSVLHNVLEGASPLLGRFYERDAGPEEIRQIVEELFAANEEQFEAYRDNSRTRYFWRRLHDTAVEAVTHLREQMAAGTFVPRYFEWRFGSGKGSSLPPLRIPLSDGREIRVRGIVDRVDLLQEDGITYVRVIDYKSGTKSFEIDEIANGVSFQLPIYLEAVTEGLRAQGKEVRPAGIFYFHLNPKIERAEGDRPEKWDSLAEKNSCLDGVVSDEKAVINGMARDPFDLPMVLGLSVTKKGQIFKSSMSRVKKPEELEALSSFSTGIIARMAEEELAGCIRQYPYHGGWNSTCSNCTFRDCCSFDIRQKGAEERWKVKTDKDVFWKQIMEEGSDGDE